MNRKELRHFCPHIPKTGGTSLKDFYTKMWGPEEVLVYETLSGEFRPANELASQRYPSLTRLKDTLVQTGLKPIVLRLVYQFHEKRRVSADDWQSVNDLPWKVLIGHFPASRGKQVDHNLSTIVLRDPLTRIHSQYKHWSRSMGTTRFERNEPYYDSNSPLSFLQFAMHSEVQNYQARFLDGVRLDSFDLIGTTKHLDLFASQLLDRLGFSTEDYRLEYLNQGPEKSKPTLSETTLEQFKARHSADYLLYEKALELSGM